MKNFTKADLRTGDLVVTHGEGNFIVALNAHIGISSKNVLLSREGWNPLSDYKDNLDFNYDIDSDYDIVRVYRSVDLYNYDLLSFNIEDRKLIYDREAEEAKSNEEKQKDIRLMVDGKEKNVEFAEIVSYIKEDFTVGTRITIKTK